jgi:ABC-2 type transport system permease protein
MLTTRWWRRSLRFLWLFMHRQVLGVLSWRGFMLTLVIQQTVTPLLGLAVWSDVLPGQRAVTAYFVALIAVQLATVCYEADTYLHGINSGALAGDLLHPYPTVLQVMGDNLAWRAWHVGLGGPVVIVAALLAGVSFRGTDVLLAVPAVALAGALRFLFSYVLVLTALWTEQSRSVVALGNTLIFLLGGAAAPLTFFPERFRLAGEVLPFRAMHGFPAEIAAGALSATQMAAGYAWQAAWLALFSALAVWMWNAGVRRFTAVGG